MHFPTGQFRARPLLWYNSSTSKASPYCRWQHKHIVCSETTPVCCGTPVSYFMKTHHSERGAAATYLYWLHCHGQGTVCFQPTRYISCSKNSMNCSDSTVETAPVNQQLPCWNNLTACLNANVPQETIHSCFCEECNGLECNGAAEQVVIQLISSLLSQTHNL